MMCCLIQRSARSTIASDSIPTILRMQLRGGLLQVQVVLHPGLISVVSIGVAVAQPPVAGPVSATSLRIFLAAVRKSPNHRDLSLNAVLTLKCLYRFRSKKRYRE